MRAQILHQRNAADWQQDDGTYGNAAVLGDQRMAHLMQDYATKHYPYQCHTAPGAGCAHRGRLRQPHEDEQRQKGKVDAYIDSEQTARRN